MRTLVRLECAAAYAVHTDARNFRHGALGVRADGAQVLSRNSASEEPNPDAHAEARLARKMGGGIVYVARVTQAGDWAMSRPCLPCLLRMRSKGVERVYYTISPGEYGVLQLRANGVRAHAYRRGRR